jgi:hypothetical protein
MGNKREIIWLMLKDKNIRQLRKKAKKIENFKENRIKDDNE